MRNAVISGVGKFVPPDVLTNHDLEKMVETSDEWIYSRTGIKQRHILKDPDKSTTYMATEAAKNLVERTNLDPKEVDLIITGTVTPDFKFPDTSNAVATGIGAENAFGFDVNAACSGFLFSLTTAAAYIKSGMYDKIIVIGADRMSSIVNYTDRTTCILFGDAAGAIYLEAQDTEYGYKDQLLHGDGTGGEYLNQLLGGSLNVLNEESIKDPRRFIYQDGRPVFKRAVNGMSSSVKAIMEKHNLSAKDVDWVVPHQANQRIISAVADQMDFPQSKVMNIIENYGNTTAATLPLCLNEYESQLKKGDNLIFTAFGGGFTWGSIYLQWAYDAQ